MSEQRVSAAEDLAMRFHEAYERLAPSFGYSTREASAKPWAEVPLNNKALMIAVCHELLGVDGRSTVATLRAERDALQAENGRLRKAIDGAMYDYDCCDELTMRGTVSNVVMGRLLDATLRHSPPTEESRDE